MKSDFGYNGNRPMLPQKLVELFTARGAAFKALVGCKASYLFISVPNSLGTLEHVMFRFSGVRDRSGTEVWVPEESVRSSSETSMTYVEWLSAFADELIALRPHLGEQVAPSVAMSSFHALGNGCDPRKAALEYHLRQESLAPRPQSKTK